MYLIVLDDAEISNLLVEEALRALEHVTVKSFVSPSQAMDFANVNAGDIALFIVDYEMPEMNGIEFATKVLRNRELVHTPIVMITSFNQRSIRRSALAAGVTDFLTKPFDPFEIRARTKNLLDLNQARRNERQRASCLAEEVAKAVAKIEEREREIVTRLVIATEYRDRDTGAHVQRVAAYVELIACNLGHSESDGRVLALASTMHDIGKIAVSDAILLKQGPLTAQERAEINAHTEYGCAMLEGSAVETLRLAAQIALSHHERWDGTGYPRGLSGHDIPMCGRITAVADTFDALVSQRPYKTAWPLAEARDYLESQAGAQFDPDCVRALTAGWDRVQGIAASGANDWTLQPAGCSFGFVKAGLSNDC